MLASWRYLSVGRFTTPLHDYCPYTDLLNQTLERRNCLNENVDPDEIPDRDLDGDDRGSGRTWSVKC